MILKSVHILTSVIDACRFRCNLELAECSYARTSLSAHFRLKLAKAGLKSGLSRSHCHRACRYWACRYWACSNYMFQVVWSCSYSNQLSDRCAGFHAAAGIHGLCLTSRAQSRFCDVVAWLLIIGACMLRKDETSPPVARQHCWQLRLLVRARSCRTSWNTNVLEVWWFVYQTSFSMRPARPSG